MSKLVLSLLGVGGLLITAAVAGHRFLFSDLLKLIDNFYELPSKEEDLEKEIKEDECIQQTFSGLSELTKSDLKDLDNEEKLGSSGEPNGCLVINWDKWKGKGDEHKDKWRGNFRFLWTFARGNSGFLVYFTADTPEPPPAENPKLKAKGIAYVLSKDTSKNTWSISKGKKINQDWDMAKLPKIGTGLKSEENKDGKWDFSEGNADLSKLCSLTDCPEGKTLGEEMEERISDPKTEEMLRKIFKKDLLSKSRRIVDEWFRGWWVWEKGDGQETPDKWSTNLTEWWKEIYSEENKWKMEEVLKGINGKWREKGVFLFPPAQVEDKGATETKST